MHVAIWEAMTHVRHLEEQVRLYDKGLLPQARQALRAELANYQVGRGGIVAVLAARMDLYRYERDYQLAIADYQKMLADIETLTAEGLPAPQEAP
ncbi:Outer membrane efflux protein [compost metagenome]